MGQKPPAPSPGMARGKPPGENCWLSGWFSHDLFISTVVVVRRDPRDKFWPSDSSGELVIPTDFNRSCWKCSIVRHISGGQSGCRALVFVSCSSFSHGKYPETTSRRPSGG